MKEVRCGEVGLFPDCDGVIRGETEEEVVAKSAEHAREVHGMTDDDFTDENVEKIREHIKTT